MYSRERVLQSMNFMQPDRVALDFGGHHSSGIMAIAYKHLRNYLGLPESIPKVYDIPQQLAIIEEDVLEQFNIDVIELGRGFCQDYSYWKPWVLPDGSKCLIPKWINPVRQNDHWIIHHPDGTPIAIQKKGMLYFEQTCFPLSENPEKKLDHLEKMLGYNMWSALAAPPGPAIYDEDGLRFLIEGAKRLRERESRAIIGVFGGSLFEIGQMLFRMENYYYLLAANPDLIHRFLDNLMAIYMRDLELYLKAVGQYIDIILFSDDYGMQIGLQISPDMFRKFFKPRHKQLWGYAKKLANVKVLLHCCGSIAELLPDLIDAGLDAVNPVQINSNNMEPARLKAEFGNRIVFWGGGCNTQQMLSNGTPGEIRDHVLKNLDIFAPGGGYVFQQVHNIMADVPPENVVAMFEAFAEWNDTHN